MMDVAVAKIIAATIQVIVHLRRVEGGARRVTNVREVEGLREEVVLKEVFSWAFERKDESGRSVYGLVQQVPLME